MQPSGGSEAAVWDGPWPGKTQKLTTSLNRTGLVVCVSPVAFDDVALSFQITPRDGRSPTG